MNPLLLNNRNLAVVIVFVSLIILSTVRTLSVFAVLSFFVVLNTQRTVVLHRITADKAEIEATDSAATDLFRTKLDTVPFDPNSHDIATAVVL